MRRLLPIALILLLLVPAYSHAVTRATPEYYSTGGVTLKLTEPAGSIYRPGEPVRFTYTTDTDAYVIIFDIDTDGYVHLLHPENGRLSRKAVAGQKYVLPDYGESSLIVAGATGLELVFALAVPDRNQIDEEELGFLLENERLPLDRKFRIDGDPLLAANMITSELVRNISQLDGISLAYTYFYVNDIVEYPRYLCAECHESRSDPYERPCDKYEFTGDFSKTDKLTYPLGRGFQVAELGNEAAYGDRVVQTTDQPETNIYVSFYPYDSYIYTPRTLYSFYAYDPWYWTPLWADPWWHWDPYYPGHSRHSFYFAWSWNWGSWGWSYWTPYRWTYWGPYHPYRWGGYHDYWYRDHRHHRYDYAYRPFRPQKYRYKSDLIAATQRNATRDRNLLVGTVRSKTRGGTDVARYYKARDRSSRSKDYTRIADRTKSRSIYSRQLKDRSRDYIKRDRSYLHNDRTNKSRTRPYIQSRQKPVTRDSKARTYRSKDRRIDRTKKQAPAKSRDRRTYNPQKRRSTTPPSRVKSPARSKSSNPPRSSTKSYKGSSSRSGSSKAKSSSRSSGRSSNRSSRSKSGGKTRR